MEQNGIEDSMKQLFGIVTADIKAALRNDEIETLTLNDLTVLYRETDITDYRLLDQAGLFQCIAEHQEVIERVAQEMALLPIQFGALLEDEQQIASLLRQHSDRFHALFDEMGQLVQMELAVLWDAAEVSAEITSELGLSVGANTAEDLQEQGDFLSGGENLYNQLRLGQQQKSLAQKVQQQMDDVAKSVIRNTQNEDEQTAVRMWVLIGRGEQEKFAQAAEALQQELGSHYNVYWQGPQRPHHFIRITVKTLKPLLIDHARELLGVGLISSLAEIKDAYYNHPHHIKPDRNSDLDSIVKMTELAQSYKLLKELGESQEGDVCYLDEEAVQQTVVVAIKRM